MRQPSRAGEIGRQDVLVKRRELRGRAILAGQRAGGLRMLALRGEELRLRGAVALLDIRHALRQRIDDHGVHDHVDQQRDRQRDDRAPMLSRDALDERPPVQVASHAAPPNEHRSP